MTYTREEIRREADRAPAAGFSLHDVRARRDARQRRRRLTGGAVGALITVALVVSALGVARSGGGLRIVPADGGTGLPKATDEPIAIGPGQYSYVRIRLDGTCTFESCPDPSLTFESWWKADDSGRIAVIRHADYGIKHGTFGPGEFHTEGDLSAFPLDAGALEAYLLERSSADGASPRPDVTPSPGVPLEEGLLWNSIRDYLGSTQYLNATPQLRAAMLEVLARVPMVQVDLAAKDPVGRHAYALWFFAYQESVVVFVDPASHDFLGMRIDRTDTGGSFSSTLVVEAAGVATSVNDRPGPDQRSIPSG